ncbi:uncharacterized protein LOC118274576 [Spodoptera frugiperda]|uniref:Uncharacterized protein LOC118274576 n=1 Tax=Spodoptera frugiperda TaxID=7108 RepID=A0A9R0DCD5_SPOFR|nr:uncharacterized protein LOC118274576 [Spodoptera frugiperda]
MFVIKAIFSVLSVFLSVEAVPVVFKESTPNGESIVAISSSDPNVEKYFTEQFATRSGFTQVHPEEQNRPYNNGPNGQGVHSSVSIAVPGKAVAGAGRSFASASTGPFVPLFAFPIAPEGFGFNNFDLKDWVRNVESFYNPHFAGNGQVNTATAINDNGHIYGNVNKVAFDNREKSTDNFNSMVKKSDNSGKIESPFDKKAKNNAINDNKGGYRSF